MVKYLTHCVVCVCVSVLVCVMLAWVPCLARVSVSSVPFTACLGFRPSRSCSAAVLLRVSTDTGITNNQTQSDQTRATGVFCFFKTPSELNGQIM